MKATRTPPDKRNQNAAPEAPEWPKTYVDGNIRVKIYRRLRANGSIGFEVSDHSAGKRRLISRPTEELAFAEARRIAGLLIGGHVEAAQMTSSAAASYGRAVELLRPTATPDSPAVPLEIAAGRFAEAFMILGGDRIIEAAKFLKQHDRARLTPRTVREVVDEFIALKESKGKSPRYIGDLKSRLNRFANAFGVSIADVTTGDVQGWLDKLNVSAQTAKNFRTVVGSLFNHAERRGYILKGWNPVADTEREKVSRGSIEIYTPEEIGRLLAAAGKTFRPCVAIGAFAGLRSAEIERLEWQDVNFDAGHITVGAHKSKTASRRIVPLTENLRAWLTPHRKTKGRVWPGTHDEFYEAQQATADGAQQGKGKAPLAWKHNGLRHSFASYRLAAVQSAAQVALEMGNSPGVVFAHYRELVTRQQAEAWFSVMPKQKGTV